THVLAALVALVVPRLDKKSCTIVFAIGFLAPVSFGVPALKKAAYLRCSAVYDRFRENLASPIPRSVSSLRFVPLEESIRPDLMFRFDVDPPDLDALLEVLKLDRIEPESLPNPRDFFRHAYYLPVEGNYQLFQGKDKSGDILTIKTNEGHS